MNYEIWRAVFQGLVYFGSAVILIGTIGVNCCSTKIENIEKKKVADISIERDGAIKRSNEKADALYMLNRFLSEVDNRIEKLYLHLDLGSTIISDLFSDFSCFIYFHNMDVLLEIKSSHVSSPLSKNALFLQTRLAKGHDLNESTLIMSESYPDKNTGDLLLDISYLMKDTSARDFSIRDLHNELFEFIISKKHSKYVKNLNINVNHWHVFRWATNESNWKQSLDEWLTNGEEYVTLFRTENTRHLTVHRINFYEQGVQQFEIVPQRNFDDTKLSKSDLQRYLSDVDANEGTMLFQIDNRWLTADNALIEYLPLTQKDNFEIRIFRDIDNILKVLISTSFSNDVILSCKDTNAIPADQKYHDIVVTWGEGENCLYLNGKLIDSFQIK